MSYIDNAIIEAAQNTKISGVHGTSIPTTQDIQVVLGRNGIRVTSSQVNARVDELVEKGILHRGKQVKNKDEVNAVVETGKDK